MRDFKLLVGKLIDSDPARHYVNLRLEELVGRTLTAVGQSVVEGEWGDEDCLWLFFDSDDTPAGFNGKHGIILQKDV